MGWDDITIPLRLRAVRVIGVLENTLTRLKIEVRSGWSVSLCPSCGHKCSRVHDNPLQAGAGSDDDRTAGDAGVAAPAVRLR